MNNVASILSSDGPSQADTRAPAEFTDQHGRTWIGNTENKTRHPVGMPDPQFDAPLIPLQNYLTMKGTNRIVIEYRKWLSDIDASDEEYDRELRNYATQLYGEKALDALENPTPQLLALAGERPSQNRRRPPRDFIEACLTGNQWVLGLNPNVPPWARKHLAVQEEKQAPAPIGEYPDSVGPTVESEDEYEFTMGAPGKWRMPDGGWFAGKREAALEYLEQKFPEHHRRLLVEA